MTGKGFRRNEQRDPHLDLTGIYGAPAQQHRHTGRTGHPPRETGSSLTRQTLAHLALAGAAQWTEPQPPNQEVTGSIPTPGTCLGCGPGPQLRGT